MKNTIEIGDTVVRRARERDSFWKRSCDNDKLPVDGHYVVVGFSCSRGGLKLQGFNNDYSFTETCFDLVELTPEQEYKEAKKLIGKTILVKGTTFKYKVDNVVIRRDNDKAGISGSCISFLEKHGYVVAIKGDGLSFPFPDVVECGEEIYVKLNDKHDAIVTKDGIAVGCQTFSHDIVYKLKKAIERINK